MSRPEGSYKTDDCRAQKFYVCENNTASASASLLQGGNIFKYFYVQMSKYLVLIGIIINQFLETYIYSPDYLNSYPNSYEQVNMVDSVSTSDYTLTYCRPGNCLLLEGKPSPSPSRDCTWSTILTLVADVAIMWR